MHGSVNDPPQNLYVRPKSRKRSESTWFAATGSVLLFLSAVFLWSDMAIHVEYVLVLAAFALTVLGLLEQPRARPGLPLAGLVGIALLGTGWYAGGAYLGLATVPSFQPVPLLLSIAVSLVGTICIAATSWRRLV